MEKNAPYALLLQFVGRFYQTNNKILISSDTFSQTAGHIRILVRARTKNQATLGGSHPPIKKDSFRSLKVWAGVDSNHRTLS